MKVRVTEIKIKNRIRNTLQEIDSLKQSIQHIGLLHPLIIDPDYNLISGARRLEAVKQLGWELVDVKILDVKDTRTKILIELEENVHRVNFTELEINSARKMIQAYSSKNIFKRFYQWLKEKLR